MTKKRVLFLCTGNCCRSQMAEALFRHDAAEEFEVCSAGSHPAGFLHELAIGAMAAMGIRCDGQWSKSWDELADSRFDVVITLCDAAAEQACPDWLGAPIRVHWPMPDPAMYAGSEAERRELAMRIADRLRLKIQRMIQLDWSGEREVLTEELTRLGDL
ncbi:MAG: arsenate reductase ArsC [Planctomycetes bacterium]|nr:arsenate reductase ArsC [Planctomycetota bacterium]